jgi:hypothetical protein
MSDRSRFHTLYSGQVEWMRAEGCGIADTAERERHQVPSRVLLFR